MGPTQDKPKHLPVPAVSGYVEEGEVCRALPDCPLATPPAYGRTTQTKIDVDKSMGPRGPGANEGDFLLTPHLAEIHPGRLGGWVCEPLAGYK